MSDPSVPFSRGSSVFPAVSITEYCEAVMPSRTASKSWVEFWRLYDAARKSDQPRPNVYHYFADRYAPTFTPEMGARP